MNQSGSGSSLEYPFGLFERIGIELEYMIVHRDTLDVLPACDKILYEISGTFSNDVMPDGPEGDTAWSNELALHVLEFKTLAPAETIYNLDVIFRKEVARALEILENMQGILLPTAMHPWMNPEQEFKIWPHGDREIYETFDSIFSCKGHGWSNLQSMHINLPFRNDEEFLKLHSAIRLILPLITALTASSPFIEGKYSGLHDTRMNVYRTNCSIVPSLTAMIVPEPVKGISDYHQSILNKIYQDIKPFPGSRIISEEWVNARGAIARFDRGTIEIRTADLQECPSADLACAELIIETLKAFIFSEKVSSEEMNSINTENLYMILMDIIKTGEKTIISDSGYLEILDMPGKRHTAEEILWTFFDKYINDSSPYRNTLKKILTCGSLSTRIKRAAGPDPDIEKIYSVYKDLSFCLKNDVLFVP